MSRFAVAIIVAATLVLVDSSAPGSMPREPDAMHVAPVPTLAEALAYLNRDNALLTPADFQRWSGVTPSRGPICDLWRMADGVLKTNCIQSAGGKLLITCWGVASKRR